MIVPSVMTAEEVEMWRRSVEGDLAERARHMRKACPLSQGECCGTACALCARDEAHGRWVCALAARPGVLPQPVSERGRS